MAPISVFILCRGAQLPDGGRTVAFGASLLDYDNDGWPDLAFVTSTDQVDKAPPFPFLFHNRGGSTFEDRTYLLGAQESRDERGLSVADLDRDGRLDLWCGGHGEPPRILRNTVPSGASFSVRLRGHTSNREGVGSVVRARLGGRVLVQEMGASGSAYGSGERRLLFGIGSADHAESVEVHWPSGFVQQAGPVRAGQDLVVEEPALLQVQPPVLTRGATAQIIINPPGGGAAGHLVELVLEPEAQTVPVTSVGNNTYVARVAPTPGLHAVRATIDGLSLRARPQLLVR